MSFSIPMLSPVAAQAYADAYNIANPREAGAKRFDDVAGCTYARWEDVAAWFVYATPEQRAAAIRAEAVSGWFASDDPDDDVQDIDGDFVSTPCYDQSDPLGEQIDMIEDCSASGLVLIDREFFAGA